jgi:hypothetical protein
MDKNEKHWRFQYRYLEWQYRVEEVHAETKEEAQALVEAELAVEPIDNVGDMELLEVKEICKDCCRICMQPAIHGHPPVKK